LIKIYFSATNKTVKLKLENHDYWCELIIDYWLTKPYEVVGAKNWTKTNSNHEARVIFFLTRRAKTQNFSIKTEKKLRIQRTNEEHREHTQQHESRSRVNMNKPKTWACWKSITEQ
jgi:Zn-dependent M16 (insulinase) family peptidase